MKPDLPVLLLEDLAHEGTHSVDLAPSGRFANRIAGEMKGEELFNMEWRAYNAQKLVNPDTQLKTLEEIRDFILRKYPNSIAPDFFWRK